MLRIAAAAAVVGNDLPRRGSLWGDCQEEDSNSLDVVGPAVGLVEVVGLDAIRLMERLGYFDCTPDFPDFRIPE